MFEKKKEIKTDLELEDDVSDFWKQHRNEQQERRMKRLPRRVSIIYDLQKFGFKIQKLTEFQFRITKDGSDFAFDIYPIHMLYHNTTTGRRGEIRGEVRLIPFVRNCFSNHRKERMTDVKKKLQ